MKFYKFYILGIALASLFPGLLMGQEAPFRQMIPAYSANARACDSVVAMKVPLLKLPAEYRHRALPAVVDNSKNDYWPGIQDQYIFYSCQQYSGVAYVFGYEINRLRGTPGWYWENSYPAHYTWNFMNQGDRFTGVNFLQSFDVIKQQGHMTMDDYGFDTATSVLGWISGYDKYYRGMFNRIRQVYAIEVNSTEGINTLRNYLYDHLDGSPTGGIACYTSSSGTLYNMRTLPPGTAEAGKHVIISWQSDPVHGLAVVGYNDSIRFDVNKDGQYTNNIDITGDGTVDARDWEKGGFKIANSYGNWWSDTGFVYALYRSFALNYDQGGIWNNRVYVVEADTAYHPLLTLKSTLRYNARSRIRLLAGVSTDTLATRPDHVIGFPVFNYQGGEHAMQGYDTIAGADSIELGLDVTPLLNFVPPGQAARYFFMVEERDPEHTGEGAIAHASFISYQGSPVEISANSHDVMINDNNTALVSAVAAVQKPAVQIVTSSLPPYNPGQPMQVQLQATGGRPPYDWSFVEAYHQKPSNAPEPLIAGNSIQVYHPTETFAPVALPFSFPFYGKQFDSIYVNYFGFIAFTRQNLPSPYITDETGMMRMFPLIAPSFSQQYTYQANKNDGIWFQADATRAIIRWKVSVNAYVPGSVDDFALILYPDGRFEICYGTMDNQGFVHTFYKGFSKGDEQNYDIQTQWNANETAGTSYLFYPPVVPAGMTLSKSGLLTVSEADPSVIYGLQVRVADAGRISDTKVLMLSTGLEVVHELICGAEARLQAGHAASMKLMVTNRSSLPLHNLALFLWSADPALLVTDSLYTVPLLNPGQTLTIPSAFSFRLSHALPSGYPAMLVLQAQSVAGSWKKELLFPVAAPELGIEAPRVADGLNGRLDPGEVADLVVTLKNTGTLQAQNLQLKLISVGADVAILSAPLIAIPKVERFAADEFHYRIKASRDADPGSEALMQLMLSDSSGVLQTLDFTLRIGARPVAVVSLSGSKASALAMCKALDSLKVAYDSIFILEFDYSRYASIFLILNTSNGGGFYLNQTVSTDLAAYLQHGGNLYLESYYSWYYYNQTVLMPMFQYTTRRIPGYFYTGVRGLPGTFTDSMSYDYTSPFNVSVFTLEPVVPAYATLTNSDSVPKNLEVVYDGSGYKTIGTMVDFSMLSGTSPPSTQVTLMQRYLEFFDLNTDGPYPLFHAAATSVCRGWEVTFTDDSFDSITSRSWEFQGGIPAASSDTNPVVRYDSSGTFDVKLTVSSGARTSTIMKQQYIHVGQCSGEAELSREPALFRIFPNPAAEEVTIELNRSVNGNCKLMLLDLTGRKVREVRHQFSLENKVVMDLSGLKKGLYFLSIRAGNESSTQKLIKN